MFYQKVQLVYYPYYAMVGLGDLLPERLIYGIGWFIRMVVRIKHQVKELVVL